MTVVPWPMQFRFKPADPSNYWDSLTFLLDIIEAQDDAYWRCIALDACDVDGVTRSVATEEKLAPFVAETIQRFGLDAAKAIGSAATDQVIKPDGLLDVDWSATLAVIDRHYGADGLLLLSRLLHLAVARAAAA